MSVPLAPQDRSAPHPAPACIRRLPRHSDDVAGPYRLTEGGFAANPEQSPGSAPVPRPLAVDQRESTNIRLPDQRVVWLSRGARLLSLRGSLLSCRSIWRRVAVRHSGVDWQTSRSTWHTDHSAPPDRQRALFHAVPDASVMGLSLQLPRVRFQSLFLSAGVTARQESRSSGRGPVLSLRQPRLPASASVPQRAFPALEKDSRLYTRDRRSRIARVFGVPHPAVTQQNLFPPLLGRSRCTRNEVSFRIETASSPQRLCLAQINKAKCGAKTRRLRLRVEGAHVLCSGFNIPVLIGGRLRK